MKSIDELRQDVIDEIAWLESQEDQLYHNPRAALHGGDCGVGEARVGVYKALARYYKAGGASAEFDDWLEAEDA